MEFLDPKAKKRHRIRLVVGYALMGTLISIITLILVFQAYGFDVDRKTGEVIQNGLIYIDSAPDQATIRLNNQEQKNKTNNRFSIPSGDYTLNIQKNGYRDWNRTFSLSGSEVRRFTYPLLIPNQLTPTEVQSYDAAPTLTTESPDRRYMIAAQGNSFTNFTEFDLGSVNNNKPVPDTRQFTVPVSVFSATTGAQSLELVEWSTDNKHFLVKHTYGDKFEFIIISRDQPATSFNINQLLGVNPDKIALKDKKFDQWHIYTQQGGILQTADAKKVITPLLTNVTAFKSHGDDTLLYAQTRNDGKDQRISMLQGKDTYQIRDVNGLSAVMLDLARYDGKWIVIAAVDSDQKTYVYQNPQETLNKKDGTLLTPLTILKMTSPLTAVSFSQNTRFSTVQSGQHFELYDAEDGQVYRFDITDPITAGTKVTWMDGHRLIAHSNGNAIIVDFDGSNKQTLLPTAINQPVLFDRDYTVMYNVAPLSAAGKLSLQTTQLRQPEDR